MKRSAIICKLTEWVSSIALAAAVYTHGAVACDIQPNLALPKPVADANEAIRSGRYTDFVGLIDPFESLDVDQAKAIAAGLADFSEDGFSNCIVMDVVGQDGLFSRSLLFFYTGDKTLFVFYGAVKMGSEWKIIKSKFSSDFDEIYSLLG